ncbi:Uncharacterized protein conserved in bacteria [uncultured Clostridium sp.]|nr:Uncharacterized protein conserved in bacteria [uncultured Clostridium sp.]
MEGIDKNKSYEKDENDSLYILKMIFYSIIGIIIFFIPININNQTQTMLYHISDLIQLNYREFLKIYIILFMIIGSIKSFIDNKNKIYFSFRILSVIILLNVFYGNNYIFFQNDNTPLIIKDVVLNLITVLPISAVFMPFILEYGLLEIIESYFHPIMKKYFKISGKALIIIFIYLFTDCFCGYYMTHLMYSKGKLRLNELYTLLINFSTMSFYMMSYTYSELNLNSKSFILVSLLILIISNMVLCRIYPLSKIKKSYYVKTNYKESIHKKDKFKKGINKHLENKENRNIFEYIIENLGHVLNLNMKLISNLIVVFFLGDLLFNNNSVIEFLSQIFYPIISTVKFPDASLISKSIIRSLYNSISTIDLINFSILYDTRFIIGIFSVIIGISFTTNLTYIYSANIKIDKKYFIIMYFEKVALTILLYSIIYYSYRGYII